MSDEQARRVYAAARLGQSFELGSRPAVLVVLLVPEVLVARRMAALLPAALEATAGQPIEDVLAHAPVGHLTAAPAGGTGLLGLVVVEGRRAALGFRHVEARSSLLGLRG